MALQAGIGDYVAMIDLRPDQQLLVRESAALDCQTGALSYGLVSLDPSTLQLPSDPGIGFLPPNVTSPEGEGAVSFTAMPKPGLATGTQICNQAHVVFDTNAPIDTPTWCNTIDASKPVSHVAALPAQQSATSFQVQWSGTDDGSGILDYTVYVSEDGATAQPWMQDTTATSATFTGQTGKSYAFFSIARDQVGNVQEMPSAPDTTTRLGASPPGTGGFRQVGLLGARHWVRGPGIPRARGLVPRTRAAASRSGSAVRSGSPPKSGFRLDVLVDPEEVVAGRTSP